MAKSKKKPVNFKFAKKRPEEGILIKISAEHSTSGKTNFKVIYLPDNSIIESGSIENSTIPQCGYIVLCKVLEEYQGLDIYMFDQLAIGFVLKGGYTSKSYSNPLIAKCDSFVQTLTGDLPLFVWDRKQIGGF